MKLISDDGASSIEFRVFEVQLEHFPSANVLVRVDNDDVMGSTCVWIEAAAWDAFVDELRRCELVRQGRATLAAMSPEVFELYVEDCDRLGHFAVRYRLTRRVFLRSGSIARTVSGGFDMDSEWFSGTVQAFPRFDALRTASHDGNEHDAAG